MPLRRLALVDLGLLAILVLASRLALLAHEGAGHALPALAFGAERVELRMSPLGGGSVRYRLPSGSPGRIAAIKLGGIAVNLATGLLAWWAARRMASRGLAHAGLLFFGVGSVAGALAYLSNGLYYGSGDPVGFAPHTLDISPLRPLWLLGPPAAAAVAALAARHWLDVLPVAPRAALGRVGWTLATLGVAGAAYGGLWLSLRDGREGSTRQWRVEREIAKESERRASTAPPVRAEEVAHRVPSPLGPIAFYAAAALGGLFGLARGRGRSTPDAWRTGPILALSLAAAVVVALLISFG